jgi:hypothetical protein
MPSRAVVPLHHDGTAKIQAVPDARAGRNGQHARYIGWATVLRWAKLMAEKASSWQQTVALIITIILATVAAGVYVGRLESRIDGLGEKMNGVVTTNELVMVMNIQTRILDLMMDDQKITAPTRTKARELKKEVEQEKARLRKLGQLKGSRQANALVAPVVVGPPGY